MVADAAEHLERTTNDKEFENGHPALGMDFLDLNWKEKNFSSQPHIIGCIRLPMVNYINLNAVVLFNLNSRANEF